MLRLIALLLMLSAPAFGAEPPFTPSRLFPQAGPAVAAGVLVWVPGTYGKDAPGPPDPPDIVGRLAGRGLDVVQFLRKRDDDPLDRGARILMRGLKALRLAGYRRIIVAGHSRGAWIALTALAHPNRAHAIIAVSTAAHGTRPERQIQARADWQALWASARPAPTRVVLVQLAEDPYDPDPQWRLDVVNAAVARTRIRLMSIFQPPLPLGHGGVYEPAFDERHGALIADFADPR